MTESISIQAQRIFRTTNAIITDEHFVYAQKPDGWYHGADYVNKDAIYLVPDAVSSLCRLLACSFKEKKVDIVVGPTIGGAILSQWTASWLGKYLFKRPFAVFADEVNDKRVIKRGYDAHVKDKQCLIVEDVINSGLTVMKTKRAILDVGGKIVGVAALCNRSGGKATAETLGVPELISLLDLNMIMYKEEACPICKIEGPQSVRTDLGKGKEFLARIGKA